MKPNDQDKWLFLLDYSIEIAEEVEFNVFRKSKDFNDFLKTFYDEIVDQVRHKDKIYFSKEMIRFKLSKNLIEYIKEKTYSSWYNNFIEDISFLKDGVEFFAAITHENYIIMRLSDATREQFNKQGFNFEMSWPYPYDKK